MDAIALTGIDDVKSILKSISDQFAPDDAGDKLDLYRRRLNHLGSLSQPDPQVVRSNDVISGVPCEWHTPPEDDPEWKGSRPESSKPLLVYLHGGAYIAGSLASHRNFVSKLARDCGMPALAIDYRLAPEAPFPAARDDALAVYDHLRGHGLDPQKCVFIGDSAGAGLTISALLAMRDQRKPLPAAAMLICPWLDLTCQSPAYARVGGHDPILTKQGLKEAADLYIGKADARNPGISPVFADPTGLPALFIHAAEHDVLVDEAAFFAEAVLISGGDVTFRGYKDMIHVWHAWFSMLPAAEQAILEIAGFVRSKVNLAN